ncbi:origin of replication complex subunit 6 [Selaginella moellendorffii]|uniref:origin of replication complex subunit 6 n=1 Tax=Selaginella moellendorffii TaxID=88036 RepID=UPI000D1C6861|nr:origin of replication complex subunit 6 [Selaginella moellendorffii]|eukprot:XP_024530167.1 origin of replication complex subunit 6 [Selaginella moellendorffii]
MEMKALEWRLGMAADREVLRKAEELLRLCRMEFDAAAFGIGDVCRSVLCFEIACSMMQVPFDRQKGIKLSGLSDKAYNRSLTTVQNALGIRTSLNVRELAVQFGCVRLIQAVQRVLAAYKERFLATLPEARRRSADFDRPVFTSVAFYLCARKQKLKVDKAKLMEVSSTSDPEFSNVAASMTDICFDLVGVEKEKSESRTRGCKRALSDATNLEDPGRTTCLEYEEWKEAVLSSSKQNPSPRAVRDRKQARLNFESM